MSTKEMNEFELMDYIPGWLTRTLKESRYCGHMSVSLQFWDHGGALGTRTSFDIREERHASSKPTATLPVGVSFSAGGDADLNSPD